MFSELPSNLSTIAQVLAAINQRIRDIQTTLQGYLQNPSTVVQDMGTQRIINMADPQDDLDAVNLRYLRKFQQAPNAPVVQPAAEVGIITFGVDDDSTGENLIGKYGIVLRGFVPGLFGFTAVTPPTSANTIFEIWFSRDNGATFAFAGRATFATTATGNSVTTVAFNVGFIFKVGDLIRLDGIQSGGAQGLVLVVAE